MSKKMTLEEIRTTSKVVLTPDEACGVLGCTAQLLRMRARDPEKRRTLGFPIMAIGNRVKIPTKGLLRFLEGGEPFIVETNVDKIAKKFYDELILSGISESDKESILIKLSELIYDGRK